jgi:GT2 family glycosyltransferase
MQEKPSLSICILDYNAGDLLLECLESIYQVRNQINLDIWIIDNASFDHSAQNAKKKFPKVNLVLNNENLGFSKGNNIALRKITNEYILILNPDTRILAETLPYMLDFMAKNPDVGAASCRVEKVDGSLDWASHRGFPTPDAAFKYYFLKDDSLYHLTKKDLNRPHEVDSIVGAFFLTRKSVLGKVGLFDEDYFMYGEDLDLCFRIKKAGFKVMYLPEVKVIHYKGVSSGIKAHSVEISTATKKSRQKAFNAFYQSMSLFYKKHLQKKYPFFVNWLVYLGINIKWWLAKRNMKV